ncbi:MAG TPA: ROK family protein, partial [Rectinemataceae bacterium]|nr:ROK family protein [Rectinemataceae bacterium]
MTIGAIEAGGTKFVCGLLQADSADRAKPQLIARASIPTTTPAETLEAALRFFAEPGSGRPRPDCLGIGCFGPVDLKAS